MKNGYSHSLGAFGVRVSRSARRSGDPEEQSEPVVADIVGFTRR
jgi:hypothetical protein